MDKEAVLCVNGLLLRLGTNPMLHTELCEILDVLEFLDMACTGECLAGDWTVPTDEVVEHELLLSVELLLLSTEFFFSLRRFARGAVATS